MAHLKLEVPVFSPASAQVALARASRIELNRAGSYPQGGLTPGLSDVQSLSAVPVPLRISKQILDTLLNVHLDTRALDPGTPCRFLSLEIEYRNRVLYSWSYLYTHSPTGWKADSKRLSDQATWPS